ncbi:ParB/RepB/Spo0J family partition protein [Salmonella enterica]|nr:ParB/RepB/Spo0J family partition protein [Salmonella enterica subsp. enterica serovar Mbandaka]EEJ1220482.1 ParB/RepB/Spo0J family partition protein [Salmonella enterica]ELK3355820.1 ParB/RepB/Spo0J family partition protein [Salmonella enterica]
MSKSVANKVTLESVFDENEYIMDFPMSNIIINPQVRRNKNPEKINEIAKSIEAHGQQQPVVIGFPDDDGNCPLYFGFTRYFAQEQRGSETIKAVQREKPQHILVTQFVENLHRENLNIVDIALGINELKEKDGLKAKDICEQLQLSSSQVSKYTSIGSMPVDLLDRVSPLSNDIDTFYYLSQIYKRSPADVEQLIAQGEKDGELNRVTVRSASDNLKNANGNIDNSGDNSGAGSTDGSSDDSTKTKGKKGKNKTDDGDQNNGDNNLPSDDSGTNDIKTGDDSEANHQLSTGMQASTQNVARIWVSFEEEGQAIEGELIVSADKKPSDKNSAIVLIDGLLNELPLEELTFVRISY